MRTHCFEIFTILKRGFKDASNKELLTVVDLHYTHDGIRSVVKDNFDGQKYEISIKPISETPGGQRKANSGNFATRSDGYIGYAASESNGNGEPT